jgi:ribosomal protein S27E
MVNEEELFTVSCVNCNNQTFKFSRNLLENTGNLYLKCPKCKEETKITNDGFGGIIIEKN